MLELSCVAAGYVLATVGAVLLAGPPALVVAGLILILVGFLVDLERLK